MIKKMLNSNATRFVNEMPKATCDICKRQTTEFTMISIELSSIRVLIIDVCPFCERDLTFRLSKPRQEKTNDKDAR
jgi:hypothetical protein